MQTPPHTGHEAKLTYLDSEFDVVAPGDFVSCAVTGRQIALSDLRYWSVGRQEPYADAEAAHEAYARALKNGDPF